MWHLCCVDDERVQQCILVRTVRSQIDDFLDLCDRFGFPHSAVIRFL
jgi:hypothetical protein